MININEETKVFLDIFFKQPRDIFNLINITLGHENLLEKNPPPSMMESLKNQILMLKPYAIKRLIRTEKEKRNELFEGFKRQYYNNIELQYFSDRSQSRRILKKTFDDIISKVKDNPVDIVIHFKELKAQCASINNITELMESLEFENIFFYIEQIVCIKEQKFKKSLSKNDGIINKFINEYIEFLDKLILELLQSIGNDEDILQNLRSNYTRRILHKDLINPFFMFLTFCNLDKVSKNEVLNQNEYQVFWISFNENLEYGIFTNEFLSKKNQFLELKTKLQNDKKEFSNNIFSFNGTVWKVRFNNKSVELKKLKGMIYINLVLHNPGKLFYYINLVLINDEYLSYDDIKAPSFVFDNIELANWVKKSDKNLLKTLYKKREKYREYLHEDYSPSALIYTNDGELDIDNLPDNTISSSNEYYKKIKNIEEAIKTILKNSYKPESLEQIRKSISNNYANALKEIKDKHLEFYNHLLSYVKKSKGKIKYSPQSGITWL